jgi:hypothetical protein
MTADKFLYFDVSDPEKWMVIDGLQRISTIKSFFVEQTLTLKGLEFLTELHGKKCDDLPTNLQRTIIPAKVVLAK